MSEYSTEPIINICPSCGGKVDASTYVPYTKVVCPYCRDSMRVRPVVGGRFHIEKEIGAGGMSQVFRAVDQESSQVVALKLLNWVNSQDPERVKAFEREALLTDQVKNEHVVELYGHGWDGTMFYYAMELLEGRGLDEWMAQGPMSIEHLIDYGTQAVEGLKAADEMNLLHRDVKPANLIFDTEGRLRLVDFGLALMHGDMKSEEIWATPWYVSPETLRHEDDTPSSDIYSLGMTLRHALLGHPPFDGDMIEPDQLLQTKKQLPPLKFYYPKARHTHAKLIDLIDEMTAFDLSARASNYAILAKKFNQLDKRRKQAQSKGITLMEFDQKQARALGWLLGLGIFVGVILILGLVFFLLLHFVDGFDKFLQQQGIEFFASEEQVEEVEEVEEVEAQSLDQQEEAAGE